MLLLSFFFKDTTIMNLCENDQSNHLFVNKKACVQ